MRWEICNDFLSACSQDCSSRKLSTGGGEDVAETGERDVKRVIVVQLGQVALRAPSASWSAAEVRVHWDPGLTLWVCTVCLSFPTSSPLVTGPSGNRLILLETRGDAGGALAS